MYPHYHGFESYSWNTLLLGLGGASAGTRPALSYMDPVNAYEEFDRLRSEAKIMVEKLPSCHD